MVEVKIVNSKSVEPHYAPGWIALLGVLVLGGWGLLAWKIMHGGKRQAVEADTPRAVASVYVVPCGGAR